MTQVATTQPDPSHGDPVQGYSPAGQLMHLIAGYWTTQAICVAAELGLADLIGRKGRSVESLAAECDAHAPSLYRLLRALAGIGLFQEVAPQQFALTPMAALLRADSPGNLRAFARFQADDWHWRSWGRLLNSVRTGKPATLDVLGEANCFDYLAKHPESARLFDDAMTGYASRAHAAVVDVYDFSACRMIVDVGGGQGTLLAEILARNPQASGILFDLPEVVSASGATLERLGVVERCRAIGGDFFNVVPAGGDAYLLSTVIHDWDDERATAILRRTCAAMQPHGRVLIIENVIPADDEPHPGKFIDLEMMVIAGGRERTEAQYEALLRRAGLKLARVVPTAAQVAIVEAMRA